MEKAFKSIRCFQRASRRVFKRFDLICGETNRVEFVIDITTLMLYIKRITGGEIIKLLKKNGWTLSRISGSHHIMVKENRRSVPVPVHGKNDLPKGLVAAIIKQAGIQR